MKIYIFLRNIKRSKNLALILSLLIILNVFLFSNTVFALDLDRFKSEKIRLKSDLDSALNNLKTIRVEIDRIKHKLIELESEIVVIEEQVKTCKDNIKEIEIQLEKTIESFNESVIEFYKQKSNSLFQAIISQKDLDLFDFFKNINLLEYVIEQNSQAINDYVDLKNRYLKEKLLLEEKYEKLNSLKSDYDSTYNSLLEKEKDYEEKIENAKRKIAEIDAEIGEIQKRISEIQKQYPNLKIVDEYRVLATGYCPCPICCGKYSSGYTSIGLKAGYGVIAVDPKYIQLKTKVLIPGYGVAIAGDTGRKINNNHIDIGFDNHIEALRYGVRYIRIYKIGE
jgi:3D (Asp-Asp-Asp) domain-containing protein